MIRIFFPEKFIGKEDEDFQKK